MASIVYVSDSRMIDFHRMNGSSSMNFWRLSDKNFNRFGPGDYLFFLDKKGKKGKEKGLIGYGTCESIRSMSLSSMWNMYKSENGYATKEELKLAIEKISKTKTVPAKLNCLYLTDVIFFQGPLFLSEFGVDLPSSLESFIYLEKDGKDITSDLLEVSKSVGIDVWTKALNETLVTSSIDQDIMTNDISMITSKIFIFHEQKDKRLERKGIKGYQGLKQCPGILYKVENEVITLAFPILVDRYHKEESLYSRIMQAQYIQKEYKSKHGKDVKILFYGKSIQKYNKIFRQLDLSFVSIDA